jgi:hypothetical protein
MSLLGGELPLDEPSVLEKFATSVREYKGSGLGGEIPCDGPVPIGEDLPRRLGVSKADLVLANATSIFFNSADVVHRREDDVKVDCLPLEEIVPFGERKPPGCGRGKGDPLFDLGKIPSITPNKLS